MKLLRKKIQKRNEKDRERKLQKKKREDEVTGEDGEEGEDGECLMARKTLMSQAKLTGSALPWSVSNFFYSSKV